MMHGGMCKCPHHKFAMLLGLLGFVAAVLFFYTAWAATPVFGFDYDYYFQAVVVLSLMMFGMNKSCRCCGHGRMMQGDMGGKCDHTNCQCGNCGNCK